MANIKEATSNSQQSLRALFINFPANLDITACSLMPSLTNLSCVIISCRQKEKKRKDKNRAPLIPCKRSGYVVPGDYKSF